MACARGLVLFRDVSTEKHNYPLPCQLMQMFHLVLLPRLDRMDDRLPVKAYLDHLIDHLLINDGVAGHGVCLDNCQVAGQVLTEPVMLPAHPQEALNQIYAPDADAWSQLQVLSGRYACQVYRWVSVAVR